MKNEHCSLYSGPQEQGLNFLRKVKIRLKKGRKSQRKGKNAQKQTLSRKINEKDT